MTHSDLNPVNPTGPSGPLRAMAVPATLAAPYRIPLRRTVTLLGGLAVFACGIAAMYEARLGLSSWDVLHQGIARHTPLSFGAANVVVSLLALAVASALGARIGPGTVANAVLVGALVALLTSLEWVQDLAGAGLPVRCGLLALGVLAIGWGTALYVGAGLGAGPRDSLMLVAARRGGLRIGVARAGLEGTVVVTGALLGGSIGVGTVVFAVAIGPVVDVAFRLLAVPAGEAA
jgi:uncharacterized membrane protein YczE